MLVFFRDLPIEHQEFMKSKVVRKVTESLKFEYGFFLDSNFTTFNDKQYSAVFPIEIMYKLLNPIIPYPFGIVPMNHVYHIIRIVQPHISASVSAEGGNINNG